MEDVVSLSRSLAGSGGGPVELDYTVFAMAVLTMGLLLIVEVIRHGIDRMAQGHDFFETVLKTVYHELSTLGIVEATIFLVHQFFEVNLEKERIFADVHFTLFFVAIINALMACIIYILSMVVAHQRWVKMETLDFNHYVAIRQEFDQVEAQLKTLHKRMGKIIRDDTERDDLSDVSSSNEKTRKDGKFINVIGTMVEKPYLLTLGQQGTLKAILEKKYSDLIVQIRFHDMRVHFIEKHNLPNNFRISDYLTLAMNDAFKEFVHISTRTWLALMGCANFAYFTMGIVTYASSINSTSSYDYNEIVPIALSWMFIGYCILFIIISYLISIKMDKIFRRIIGKDSWATELDTSIIRKQSFFGKNLIGSSWSTSKINLDENNNKSQKDQFWLGKPDLIITFAQFMQFGFSVGFAILLIFQKTVRAGNVFEWWGWYFVAPSVCFFIFIWLWSVIIPLYTQCTNLGELVSKRHIIEIQAMSQLEDERNKRQQYIDYIHTEKDVAENMKKRSRMKSKDKAKKVRIRTISAKSAGDMFSDETLEQISEFVKKPTRDLPRRSRNTTVTSEASNDSFFVSSQIKESDEGGILTEDDSNRFQSFKTIGAKARKFFLSNRYRQGSAVFGTLIALYLLGLRIQVMLIDTCNMKDRDAVWYFSLREPRQIFWIVIGWLSAFIVESSVMILIFGREKDHKHFFMVIAGCFDMIVTGASMAIFLTAEIYRCCDNCSIGLNNHTMDAIYESNIFASTSLASHYYTSGDDDSYTSLCVVNAELSCCPSFGTRQCGGIGIIEPFTALVGLRLMRFFVAHAVVKTNVSDSGDITNNGSAEVNHKEHVSHKTGTIAELWILALTQYTDIVKRHGMLSANLLESMLGIESIPDDPQARIIQNEIDDKNQISSSIRDALSIGEKSNTTMERPNALLIRSMRRCACKLFPLLNDKWQIVDVALTDYEIVWFDAKVDIMAFGENEKDAIYSVKEKLRESNGGRKLRLSEVAFGRTILGRLSLSDLEHVIVQKILYQSEFKMDTDYDVETMRQTSPANDEYWNSSLISFHGEEVEKWFDVHQCRKRLKLESRHGSLYLQFFADRETFGRVGRGNGSSGRDSTRSVEDVALHWCRTIRSNSDNTNGEGKQQLTETISGRDLEHDKNDGQKSRGNVLKRILSRQSRKTNF